MPSFSGRLRELNHRGSVSRSPDTSTFWYITHFMQFLGFVYAYFYVVTESSLYTLSSVVYSANEETIPCVKWSLTEELKNKRGRGRLHEVVVYKRFSLSGFDWENFSVLERWLLMGGGRLREVVAHRARLQLN